MTNARTFTKEEIAILTNPKRVAENLEQLVDDLTNIVLKPKTVLEQNDESVREFDKRRKLGASGNVEGQGNGKPAVSQSSCFHCGRSQALYGDFT